MAEIAVIGAGLGAMAAAARLATAGHRVTVYERSDTYGGGVRRLRRDGFGFDTGPGLLHLPAVYRDLFLKTGKRPLEECVELVAVDPAERHVLPDGTTATLPASRARTLRTLDAALGPGAGEAWAALLDRGRQVWEATRRPLLEEPLGPDPAAWHEDPYPAAEPVRRGLLRRRRTPRPASLAEAADGALGLVLAAHALSYGLDPRRTPAGAVALPYLRQTFGGWYVRGGLRALADAVYERCRERRVEFAFGAEAVAVLRDEAGRAAGVELSDTTRRSADAVVAGVAPARLAELTGGAVPAAPERASTPGRLVVCLALRGARDPDAVHRTVVHAGSAAELGWVFDGEPLPPGAAPTVTVLRPDDPALRPDADHEAVTLTAAAPADVWDRPRAEDVADRMAAAAERTLPGLAARTLWREIRTPTDTAQETGTPAGAVPPPALAGASGAYLRRPNTTSVPGLYAVGGWSHPGGGLPHAGMSGALVAGLITEGPGFRGSR